MKSLYPMNSLDLNSWYLSLSSLPSLLNDQLRLWSALYKHARMHTDSGPAHCERYFIISCRCTCCFCKLISSSKCFPHPIYWCCLFFLFLPTSEGLFSTLEKKKKYTTCPGYNSVFVYWVIVFKATIVKWCAITSRRCKGIVGNKMYNNGWTHLGFFGAYTEFDFVTS